MPTPGDEADEDRGTPRSLERDESPMVNEVFTMFKTLPRVKLDEKTRQLESKFKLDIQVTKMKFKIDQKQFVPFVLSLVRVRTRPTRICFRQAFAYM